jgi:ketosteroid isomerase-like protein
MSQENVENVRRIYAVLDRGDDEAFWKLVAPDFVVDFSRRFIDPVVLRGRDQTQAWYDREGEMWEGAQPLAPWGCRSKTLTATPPSWRPIGFP